MAEFRHIIRVANTDLKGEKPIGMALQKIKGVGMMFSNAICVTTKIDPKAKTGELSAQQEEQLNRVIMEPEQHGIPTWIMNRRKDPETGLDQHLIGPDVAFVRDNDIKLMRKIKSYKGLRHAWRVPVRGQRTKSNFRPNKGKVTLKKKVKVIRK